jgi:RHS repeat-associated protein
VAPGGTTLYLGNGSAYAEKFTGSDGSVRWSNYLVAAGGLVGMHVENSDETVLTRYFHRDHLGSIAVITNESGTVLERLSYDAWGKRRYADGSDDPAGAITSQTGRGFTGHEELDAVGLVHMNGRVYDPLLARFGTPDPTTESPFSTQGWNRYSYVGNSPLNFTDPSGYCFLGCFWKPIFAGIQNLFSNVPILGTIVQIAAGVLCGPICVGIASAAIAGITSGNLGLALKVGFISAVTAFAMFGVGELTAHGDLGFGSDAHLMNIAGHALVGCGSAVASGGRCGPGALAGAAGSFAGPLLRGLSVEVKLVATSVLGGLASVAGGGKFANGALTAAFGYLFNYAANLLNDDAAGGHTFERHIGKSLDYLQGRLEDYPRLEAASTYGSYAEANAVTQRLFDQNQSIIDAWVADVNAGGRLIISIFFPLASPNFFPIGSVLERDAGMAVPGNGARAVLERAPDMPNGFRVITSYPTFQLRPTTD